MAKDAVKPTEAELDAARYPDYTDYLKAKKSGKFKVKKGKKESE